MLNTPILFLVFNRPKETAIVFEAIRKAKPKQLFVSADGPRKNHSHDGKNAEAVRAIIDTVDWDCEVKTNFREENLGCRNAVSDGITWFFNNVDYGIVLEDDCLPHPTFFNFCETLLKKYKDDDTVMHIGGNNFQNGLERSDGSYYFSKIPHIWGWACWKRAWTKYTIDMDGFEEFKKKQANKIGFKSFFEKAYWLQTFEKVKKGNVDTWDYQWVYTVFKNNGACISPKENLVTNIGFGSDATHTDSSSDRLGSLATNGIEYITHPTSKSINNEADNYWYKKIIPWQLKLKSIIKYFLS